MMIASGHHCRGIDHVAAGAAFMSSVTATGHGGTRLSPNENPTCAKMVAIRAGSRCRLRPGSE